MIYNVERELRRKESKGTAETGLWSNLEVVHTCQERKFISVEECANLCKEMVPFGVGIHVKDHFHSCSCA